MYVPNIVVNREWHGELTITVDGKKIESILGYKLVENTHENYIEIQNYEKSEYGYTQKLTKQYPVNFLQFNWINKELGL